MELSVDRYDANDERTIGKLYVDGVDYCYTLEDVIRDHKIPGETAIPAGRYRVVINFSNRFQRDMPLLLGVPGFSGVRIHSGNTVSDTEGCVLVGNEREQNDVIQSRAAFWPLFGKIQNAIGGGSEVWITLVNPSASGEVQ